LSALSSVTVLWVGRGDLADLLEARTRCIERWRGPVEVTMVGDRVAVLRHGSLDAPANVLVGEEDVTLHATGQTTALYAARGRDVTAVSTHGVDAAIGACGHVELDPVAAASVAVLGFAVGTGSLMRDVDALPVGAAVTVDRAGVAVVGGAGPFEPMDPSSAYEQARDGLLATVSEAARARLGLTQGLDSRVVLVAALHLRVPLETVTWGARESHDVVGAMDLARHAGLEHHVVPIRVAADEGEHLIVARELRNSEGVRAPFPPGEIDWHQLAAGLITGAGGETGRAFYSRWGWSSRPRPRRRDLLEAIVPAPPRAWLAPDVVDPMVDRVHDALEAAVDDGFSGWAACDHFYARQRMPHWGRAMLPPVRTTGAFLAPQTQRALASLPMREKVYDGFHHRFLRELAPALAVPQPRGPRRGVPGALRRVVRNARSARTSAEPAWRLARLVSGHAWSGSYILQALASSQLATSVLAPVVRGRVDDVWGRGELAASTIFGLSGPLALERELAEAGLLAPLRKFPV